MTDVIFADGISAYKPHEKAPDFVKLNITVDAKKFQEWLQIHPELRDGEGRVRFTVKESAKEGNKWYIAVDTYRPEPKTEEVQEIKEEDIPF